MKSLKIGSFYAVASAAAIGIAACSTSGDMGPLSPTSAKYVLTTDAVFNVGPTGGASSEVSIADGTCKVVVVDLSTGNTANSYTVSEKADPSYTLQSVQRTDIQFVPNTETDAPVTGPTSTSDPVVALINRFHGTHLVYHNNPVVEEEGCTYTKGWYRNKNGSQTIIAGIDGLTVAQQQAIFNATPGKPGGWTWGADNNNLNLYQQLLAALNNLGGDANAGPDDVDDAIADALAATSVSGTTITVAPGTDVSGLIDVLSAFNEGTLEGFPHCDDEVLTVQ
jgi:hypothetical protein